MIILSAVGDQLFLSTLKCLRKTFEEDALVFFYVDLISQVHLYLQSWILQKVNSDIDVDCSSYIAIRVRLLYQTMGPQVWFFRDRKVNLVCKTVANHYEDVTCFAIIFY